MLRATLLAGLLAVAASTASAQVSAVLPGAAERGSATFRWLGLPLYQARLFTPGGKALDWSDEFALELRYQRNLTQYDLVESTMRELARTGGALPVRGQLEKCFRDVSRGDRYLAVTQGPNRVAFWLNGRQTCTLSHSQIKSRFMAIFLGDNTQSKGFTRRLRGQ